jgi:hypothetical protein
MTMRGVRNRFFWNLISLLPGGGESIAISAKVDVVGGE